MGERDRFELTNDEITPDYPYATHWLIEAFVLDNHSVINIFPCSKNGGTTSISPVCMLVICNKNVEQILDTFDKVIEDMINDKFWNTTYET